MANQNLLAKIKSVAQIADANFDAMLNLRADEIIDYMKRAGVSPAYFINPLYFDTVAGTIAQRLLDIWLNQDGETSQRRFAERVIQLVNQKEDEDVADAIVRHKSVATNKDGVDISTNIIDNEDPLATTTWVLAHEQESGDLTSENFAEDSEGWEAKTREGVRVFLHKDKDGVARAAAETAQTTANGAKTSAAAAQQLAQKADENADEAKEQAKTAQDTANSKTSSTLDGTKSDLTVVSANGELVSINGKTVPSGGGGTTDTTLRSKKVVDANTEGIEVDTTLIQNSVALTTKNFVEKNIKVVDDKVEDIETDILGKPDIFLDDSAAGGSRHTPQWLEFDVDSDGEVFQLVGNGTGEVYPFPRGGGGDGVPEAPKDGKTYGRNNGSWVQTGRIVDTTKMNHQARVAGAWVDIPDFIPDDYADKPISELAVGDIVNSIRLDKDQPKTGGSASLKFRKKGDTVDNIELTCAPATGDIFLTFSNAVYTICKAGEWSQDMDGGWGTWDGKARTLYFANDEELTSLTNQTSLSGAASVFQEGNERGYVSQGIFDKFIGAIKTISDLFSQGINTLMSEIVKRAKVNINSTQSTVVDFLSETDKTVLRSVSFDGKTYDFPTGGGSNIRTVSYIAKNENESDIPDSMYLEELMKHNAAGSTYNRVDFEFTNPHARQTANEGWNTRAVLRPSLDFNQGQRIFDALVEFSFDQDGEIWVRKMDFIHNFPDEGDEWQVMKREWRPITENNDFPNFSIMYGETNARIWSAGNTYCAYKTDRTGSAISQVYEPISAEHGYSIYIPVADFEANEISPIFLAKKGQTVGAQITDVVYSVQYDRFVARTNKLLTINNFTGSYLGTYCTDVNRVYHFVAPAGTPGAPNATSEFSGCFYKDENDFVIVEISERFYDNARAQWYIGSKYYGTVGAGFAGPPVWERTTRFTITNPDGTERFSATSVPELLTLVRGKDFALDKTWQTSDGSAVNCGATGKLVERPIEGWLDGKGNQIYCTVFSGSLDQGQGAQAAWLRMADQAAIKPTGIKIDDAWQFVDSADVSHSGSGMGWDFNSNGGTIERRSDGSLWFGTQTSGSRSAKYFEGWIIYTKV